jgi:MFS family permease
MVSLLADRNTRLYLLAQTLSVLGDNALWLAVAVWVKSETGSNSAAALVFFTFALPQIIAPVWGFVVDRIYRRRMLVVVNLASAAVVLLLTVDRGNGEHLWLIYLVMFLYGVGSSLISAAQTALMPQMVTDDLLPNMNGALRTVQEGARLIAPLLGAGAFTAFGMTPIVVADALTFFFAAVLTGLIRLDEAEPESGDLDFWSDATAGVRHIASITVLRQVVFSTAVALLSIGFAEAIIFPVVEHGLDRPPTFIGVLVSVQGVGAVLGGITATIAVKRFGEPRTTGFGMAAFAIGTGLLIPPCLPVVVVGMAVLGFGVPWLVVGLMTLVQRRTPISVLGRVATAVEMIVGIPQVISIAVGAALVAVVDYRILIGTIVTVVSACSAYVLTRSETDDPEPVESEPFRAL